MSEEPQMVKQNSAKPENQMPQITVVTIKTPAGEKTIPLPQTAAGLLNEYNIEFQLSQKLGDSIISVQQAKARAENKSQAMLLELLTLSNQTSMQLGEIKAKKEIEEAAEEAKKKEGGEETPTKEKKTSEKPTKPPAKKKDKK